MSSYSFDQAHDLAFTALLLHVLMLSLQLGLYFIRPATGNALWIGGWLALTCERWVNLAMLPNCDFSQLEIARWAALPFLVSLCFLVAEVRWFAHVWRRERGLKKSFPDQPIRKLREMQR